MKILKWIGITFLALIFLGFIIDSIESQEQKPVEESALEQKQAKQDVAGFSADGAADTAVLPIEPEFDIQSVTEAAESVGRAFTVRCNGKNYIMKDDGYSLLEYNGGLPKASSIGTYTYNNKNGVSEADILNGLRWNGKAEIALGNTARVIDKGGRVSEWGDTISGIEFDLQFVNGKWQAREDKAWAGLSGSYYPLQKGITCEAVAERLAMANK